MVKKGYSRKTLFGGPDSRVHYDSSGKKIGSSCPSIFGGVNHYDASGKKVGYSSQGLFGVNHYDEKGKRIGISHKGLFGQTVHRNDRSGDRSDTLSYGDLSSTSGDSLSGQFMHDYDSFLHQKQTDEDYHAADKGWEDGEYVEDEDWDADEEREDKGLEEDENWEDEVNPCIIDDEKPTAIPDVQITEQGLNKIKQAIVEAIQSASSELNVNVTIRFKQADGQSPTSQASDLTEAPSLSNK